MDPSLPQMISLLTCLHVSGRNRPTLHEVFFSLARVPETFFSFVEFVYEESFAFEVQLVDSRGKLVVESEAHRILPSVSKRLVYAVELPLRLVKVLPGAYNVVAMEVDRRVWLGQRNVFFGEL